MPEELNGGEPTRREALRWGLMGLAGVSLLSGCGSARSSGAQSTVSAGQAHLAAFDPSRPGGPTTGLPRRVAWANTTDMQIFAALGSGIAAAAGDTGLQYLTANAGGDPDTNIDQIDTFLARGVGGITIQPLDTAAQAPVMRQALAQGACVIGIITSPCVLQVVASQYQIGYQQGRAAARYISSELKGRAVVFNMNQDQTSPQLALRNRGVLAGLRTGGPGIDVINQFTTVAEQAESSAFTLMESVLERYPKIDVVLGDDSPVLGAYQAMEQTGALRENMYFAGVDGDTGALDLIAQGGPYRASSAFAWPLMGYGMGRFVADWIAGRQVPRIMVAATTLVDSAAEAKVFLARNAELRGTYENSDLYRRYVPLLGNVSYAERHTIWTGDYVP